MYLTTQQDFHAAPPVPILPTVVQGVMASAKVMTLDGEIPLHRLQMGQTVITRDAGLAVLRNIHKTTAHVRAIKISRGSLGHGQPQSDMIVGPDTQISLRGWRAQVLFGKPHTVVKAKSLVDGDFVVEDAPNTATFFNPVFDDAHIIYANGLQVACARA